MKQSDLGKRAEEMAVQFLIDKKFTILHRNWRYAHYEIDIIARLEQVIHFVEVKARSSVNFAFPEDNVNKKKMGDIMKAADEFLFRHKEYRHVQFDIISINLPPGGDAQYFYIRDVYI